MDNSSSSFKKAVFAAGRAMKTSVPIMGGVLLLVNLINLSAKNYYPKIFTSNLVLDPLIGALAGSFSFGSPIVSYIVGGELLKQGISLIAVTAFIMSWTTVGVAMLPLEAKFLGGKFAFVRNGLNFIFAIVISILVILTLNLFQ
jgi:hypothetical protein